ncbi:Alpha/Beta hydrolase protein [Clohesyomyces aquaticus]|uniref:Alpha/Beta hydrolase protein n=1 Tax=Clohesyomyces aquaticus TaxID=1231657 RepID=A0A1Y1ZLH1_9PLEO|nr:Alpha/Beta hydrolase protein [Clohesyomyces aquaticus]
MSKPHVVKPKKGHAHTHTIILLHGRGATATEFAEEFFESQDREERFISELLPGIRWVFPSATPRYAETEKETMNQWFDMTSVQRPQEDVEKQKEALKESVEQVLKIIEDEARKVPREKIFVGGISQGCATALFTMLCSGDRFAGFIGLSGWLPFQEQIADIAKRFPNLKYRVHRVRQLVEMKPLPDHMERECPLRTPVFIEHCEDDDTVPVENGQAMAETLDKLGMTVRTEWYTEGGHWIKEPQGVDDFVGFIWRKTMGL